MSKFMFHLRFSREEDYLHKHELYEMLRSRNLYQVQFDLKKKLQKRIRAIELTEKVHAATFQSKKSLFLQDIQDKIRKRNKHTSTEMNGRYRDEKEKKQRPLSFSQLLKLARDDEGKQRAQTAPEIVGYLEEEEAENVFDEVDAENLDNIITTRRSLTFCGKTFHVTKSAGKSRSSIMKGLQEEKVQENNEQDGVDAAIGQTTNTPLPAIDLTQGITESKTVMFHEEDDSIKKSSKNETSELHKLSMFEVGLTTPDGQLILSRDDYDKYMDKFRQATKRRLVKQRRKSETLNEQVRRFSIDN
ncbi:hypothetical protein FSP39_010748 [Pinctada imbricata]|uniref:Uncharacterized protein n=1 Tax=Pinctada imbricata TaxID=66713 RepID=A0AA88XXL6_PINIB|nr:hypothetical protein FSP39_010748 [Pinctada imbricata]